MSNTYTIRDISGIAGIGSLKRQWMNDYNRKLFFREVRETAERLRISAAISRSPGGWTMRGAG